MTLAHRFIQNHQLSLFRLLWTAKTDETVDDDRIETISILSLIDTYNQAIIIIVNLA